MVRCLLGSHRNCRCREDVCSQDMAGAQSSPLTTHVVNTSDGVPGTKIALSLHRLDTNLMIWSMIGVGTTNEDGRCPGLISQEAFIPGMYKLRFETGLYWERLGKTSFYPYVETVFTIQNPAQQFNLPLLMSPFSYSIHRGN